MNRSYFKKMASWLFLFYFIAITTGAGAINLCISDSGMDIEIEWESDCLLLDTALGLETLSGSLSSSCSDCTNYSIIPDQVNPVVQNPLENLDILAAARPLTSFIPVSLSDVISFDLQKTLQPACTKTVILII